MTFGDHYNNNELWVGIQERDGEGGLRNGFENFREIQVKGSLMIDGANNFFLAFEDPGLLFSVCNILPPSLPFFCSLFPSFPSSFFLNFLLFVAFFLYSVSLYLISKVHEQDAVIGKAKEMVRLCYL